MATLVEDDTGTVLDYTVRNKKTNEPINLTGATVRVRWTIDGGSPVQKDMTIVDATSGRVSYQFGAGELAIVSGDKSAMRLNVVVIDAGGKVLTQVTPTTYTIRKKI
jgi:hypothetical protein